MVNRKPVDDSSLEFQGSLWRLRIKIFRSIGTLLQGPCIMWYFVLFLKIRTAAIYRAKSLSFKSHYFDWAPVLLRNTNTWNSILTQFLTKIQSLFRKLNFHFYQRNFNLRKLCSTFWVVFWLNFLSHTNSTRIFLINLTIYIGNNLKIPRIQPNYNSDRYSGIINVNLL